jgi:hypothetical protein
MVAFFRLGGRVFWLGVLVLGLAGCPVPDSHSSSLRNRDLSKEAAGVRATAKDPNKSDSKTTSTDSIFMSDRAKQISRDLE